LERRVFQTPQVPTSGGCTSILLESILNPEPYINTEFKGHFFFEVVGFLPGYLRSSAIIVCLVSIMAVLAIFFYLFDASSAHGNYHIIVLFAPNIKKIKN
jgi:hypothetical protein